MSSGKDNKQGESFSNSQQNSYQQTSSQGQLSQKDRNMMVQQAIRRRIIHNEIKKISALSMRQIIEQRRRKPPQIPMQNPNYLSNKMQKAINPMQKIKRTQDLDIEDPVRRHLQLMEQSAKNARRVRYDMKQNPILTMAKRGKFGTDSLFILFAVFGAIMLPVYFYFRFQKNRQTIIKNRSLSPQAIEALDEQSPFNIDDYSDQMVMYENPSQMQEQRKSKKVYEEMTRLRKDLDI